MQIESPFFILLKIHEPENPRKIHGGLKCGFFYFQIHAHTPQICRNVLTKRVFYDIIVTAVQFNQCFSQGELSIFIGGIVSITFLRIFQFEFGKNANSADEYGE